jgi:hypothetical protein
MPMPHRKPGLAGPSIYAPDELPKKLATFRKIRWFVVWDQQGVGHSG